jgi:hypothetical protein
MNIISRRDAYEEEEWWETHPLLPGMYITLLRGMEREPDLETPVGVVPGLVKPHATVVSPIYPFTDIAYFVLSVLPDKGATVIDLGHNNSYHIGPDEIHQYELINEFHNLPVDAAYINDFLTGKYKSEIEWFER